MLTPEDATPRALALLTLAHELYSGMDQDPQTAEFKLDDDVLHAVLADDSSEIDWQAIAISLGMIGHVLLDTIPETLYRAAEETVAQMLAKHLNVPPENFQVTIGSRITGTQLLQTVSLRVLEMSVRNTE